MNAHEATTFTQRSEAHITILENEATLRGCQCRPYTDWFTYKRWQAQAMQVQKGQKGIKLCTFIEVEPQDTNDKPKKRPKWYSVFCRCQVKPK